jgi:hypothetical protein
MLPWGSGAGKAFCPWERIHLADPFEQTIQVLVTLPMSPDAEELDDMALNREVDPLIDAYLVWARTRRPAAFRPKGYTERAGQGILGKGSCSDFERSSPH